MYIQLYYVFFSYSARRRGLVDNVYLERGEQLRICMAGDGADGDGKQIIERMIPVAETPFDTNYFSCFCQANMQCNI